MTLMANDRGTVEFRSRRDVEAMVGAESIEAIHAERRALVERLAPLRARYGPGGTHDSRRKAHRSAIQNELSAAIQAETGKKPSEAESERLAAADPRVMAMLDDAEQGMAEYFILSNEVESLNELVMRDQAVLRFACTEPRA